MRFRPCNHLPRAGSGCTGAFPVHHRPAGCWSLHSFRFPFRRAVDGGLKRNEERKFRSRAEFTLYPKFSAHRDDEAAGDGQPETHALGLTLVVWKAEEIIKNFHMIL